MTTYYVDQSQPDDSGDGLSEENAWKTIAKVETELNGDQSDDIVKFKRGETWREKYDVAGYGTIGSPFTHTEYGSGNLPKFYRSIAKNVTGDWTNESGNLWYASSTTEVRLCVFDSEASYSIRETDKGELDAQGEMWWDSGNSRVYVYSVGNPATFYNGSIELCLYSTLIDANSKDYLVFDSFDMRYGSADAIRQLGAGTHITVQYCVGKYFGYERTGAVYSGAILYGDDLASFTFDNNTVSYVWRGVYHADDDGGCVATITNNDMSYNVFRGSNTGLMAFGGATSVKIDYDGSEISGNILHHFEGSAITLSHSSTFIIEHNIIHTNTQQSDNTQIGISGGATENGWHIIRYNFIYNVKGNTGSWDGGIGINSRNSRNNQTYYNIIHDCTKGLVDKAKEANGDNDNNSYYNNTAQGCTQYGMRIHNGINGNVKTLNVQNNIFDGSTDDILVNDYVTVTGGYNCLVNDASVGVGTGSTYNGSGNDLYATDPKFLDAPNGDFHLIPSSPCRNAGVDVSLTPDYDGITVPQETYPAMGAFEYVALETPDVINLFQDFKEQWGKGVHQFHDGGHTLKIYLTNNTPSASADAVKGDLLGITEENGYAPADIQNDWSETGGIATLTGVDVTFIATAGGFGPFRYAILYNDTPSDPLDPLIGWYDFGTAITCSVGESFKVDFGAKILDLE